MENFLESLSKILNIFDYGKIEAYYCGKIATHGTKIKENRDFSAF